MPAPVLKQLYMRLDEDESDVRALAELQVALSHEHDGPALLETIGKRYASDLIIVDAVVNRILEIDPGNVDAKEVLADAYLLNGHDPDAERIAREILAERPRSVRAYDVLISLRNPVLKNSDDLVQLSQRLHEIAPDSSRAVRYVAKSLFVAGRGDEALASVDAFLQRFPRHKDIELLRRLRLAIKGSDRAALLKSWP